MSMLSKGLLWLALCITALLLAGCGQTQLNAISALPTTTIPAQQITLTPTPTQTPTHVPVSPSPTSTTPPFMIAKATYEAGLQETRVAVLTYVVEHTPRPTPTGLPPYTFTPLDLPLGILDDVELGRRICDCTFENGWRQKVNGDFLEMLAGGYSTWTGPERANQGVLIVETKTLDYLGTSGWYTYDTPTKEGSVHVTAANGLVLTLTSQSGQQFVFDAENRTWLSPPPSPSTTVTPVLTSIPSPSLPPMPTTPPLPSPSP